MFPPILAQVIQANAGIPAPTQLQPVLETPPPAEATHSQMFQQVLSDFSTFDTRGWEYTAYRLGLKAVFALILLTVAWTVAGWGSSITRGALQRIKFDETLTLFIAKLVRWTILLLAALACLNRFGVETTSFAALIGAAGLAIGLAFQGALSNFAAGTMLLVFRPYKVGDDVNVAGHSGTVREIELFTTIIDTADGRRIIVPNSSIFGAVIENVTHHPTRRITVDVGTAYAADIDETRRVLERAVRSVATVLPEPAPAVALTELAASSVNWQVRGWAKKESFGATKEAIIRAVKMELDAAGISIPFPQLDLHLDQIEQPQASTAYRRAA
jgi:small conductance mechanosensitive channel